MRSPERDRLRAEVMEGLDFEMANKAVSEAMSDEGVVASLIDLVLSQKTCQMAIRALEMEKRPTPPEIRTAARFYRADWRAVCVLVGWAETPEGEWLDIGAEGFSWDRVRPESRSPGARSPTGARWWNQELAAYAIVRSLRE